ncbi:hypothetical protein FACS1894104_0920 [Actinomycetota bacterium]|nr:hypothetical protein FACS1894104_0920 [Actinomycetota bacterium]
MNYMLANIITTVLNVYTLLVFAWAILSWFNKGSGILGDIYNALNSIVGPYVNLFRRFIPPLGGMDFSPLIALVVLQLVSRILIAALI